MICPEVIDAWQVLIMCFTLDLLHHQKKKNATRQATRQK